MPLGSKDCPKCGRHRAMELIGRGYRCLWNDCQHFEPLTWENGTFDELVVVFGLKEVVRRIWEKKS